MSASTMPMPAPVHADRPASVRSRVRAGTAVPPRRASSRAGPGAVGDFVLVDGRLYLVVERGRGEQGTVRLRRYAQCDAPVGPQVLVGTAGSFVDLLACGRIELFRIAAASPGAL